MNTKKSLTVAALMALLSVPAFSTGHMAHLSIPKFSDSLMVKAHADSFASNGESLTYRGTKGVRVTPTSNNHWTSKTYNETVHIPSNSSVNVEYYGTKKDVVQPRKIIGQYMVPGSILNPTQHEMSAVDSAILKDGGSLQGPDAEVKINGHDVSRTGAGGFYIDDREASFDKVMSILNTNSHHAHHTSNYVPSNNNDDSGSSGTTSTASSDNDGNVTPMGYTNNSKSNFNGSNINSINASGSNLSNVNSANGTSTTNSNGELPQTNESNHTTAEAILGATALTASASLMALDFSKKHKYEVMESADAKRSSNSNSRSYNKIMGDTFADLSKSLKNL